MRPKVVRSVHYCPATKKTMERKYTDLTSLDAFPSSAIYPTKVKNLSQLITSISAIMETYGGLRLYINHYMQIFYFINLGK